MKKIVLLLFVVICATGCSNLKCERIIDDEEKLIKAKFEEDKISSISIQEIKSFDKTDAYLDLYYYEQNDYLKSLNISSGFEFSVVSHKEDVTTTINIDFNQINSDISAVTSVKKGMNEEQVLNTLKNEGYVCK